MKATHGSAELMNRPKAMKKNNTQQLRHPNFQINLLQPGTAGPSGGDPPLLAFSAVEVLRPALTCASCSG